MTSRGQGSNFAGQPKAEGKMSTSDARMRALSHDDRVMEVEDNASHNIFDHKTQSHQFLSNGPGGGVNWAQSAEQRPTGTSGAGRSGMMQRRYQK